MKCFEAIFLRLTRCSFSSLITSWKPKSVFTRSVLKVDLIAEKFKNNFLFLSLIRDGNSDAFSKKQRLLCIINISL